MDLQSRLGILIAIALLSEVSVSGAQNLASQSSSNSPETDKAWHPIASQLISDFLNSRLSFAAARSKQAFERIALAAELEGIARDPAALLDRAIHIAEDTKQPTLFSHIALKLVEMGQPNRADQLFERATSILATDLDANDSLGDSYISYSARLVAVDLAQAGRFDWALEVTEILSPSADKVKVWTQIAVAMVEYRQPARARELLAEALDLAQSLTDGQLSNGSCYIERGDALAAVVEGLSEVNRRQEALEVSADIPSCHDVYSRVTDDYQASAYSDIVRNSSNLNEVEQVLEAIKLTVDARTGEGYASISAAAIRLAELGAIEQALQAIELIDKPPEQEKLYDLVYLKARGYRDHALVEIATALANAGDFERAIQTVENIWEKPRKSLALFKISQALNQADQTEKATEVFSQAMSIFSEAVEARSWDLAFEQLAIAFVRADRVEEVLLIAGLMPDHRKDSLKPIVVELVRLGHADEALKIAAFQADRTERAKLFANIAAAMQITQDSE